MIVFVAPYPPSANRYLRHTARGTYRTREAEEYRSAVAARAAWSGARQMEGPVHVSLTLHPRATKAGKSSKTVLDLDNCAKVALDALQGVCYANDKQIRKFDSCYGEAAALGALTVVVRAMAEGGE